MTFDMRRLATTLWIGKIVVGLFLAGETPTADAEALLVEPEGAIAELLPHLDNTLSLHYPE